MFEKPRFVLSLIAAIALGAPALAAGPEVQESSFWQAEVTAGDLPPVAMRIPAEPLIVDLAAKGREFGHQGGTLRTMITRSKDIRQMVVYGYARLVGYDQDYNLVPDILRAVDNIDNMVFTLHLRSGHRWSDGTPFTSEDFRYWWEDVANNRELSPSGPPDFLRVRGELPTVTFPDETTVTLAWTSPNPSFLETLAQAASPFIYLPSEMMKPFHVKYVDPDELARAVDDARVKSWAALHNKLDNMYKFDNIDLPTLQPWINATEGNKIRHLFVRNP